jgi:pilus assembly protein CpaC
VDAPAMQSVMTLAEQLAPNADITNGMKVDAPQQVQLEVRFIEADRSATKALGINTTVVGAKAANVTGLEADTGGISINDKGHLSSSLVNDLTEGLTTTTPAIPFGAMIGRILGGGTKADVFIKALEERGLARRLAEPNLVALSGDTASFLAGGEFPVPTGRDNSGQVTIEFKKYGIGLAFTPTVLSEGQINLKIEPEVSELDPSNSIVINGTTLPSLVVRKAATTVELRDGQSFAVAGLLQSRNIKNGRQLPWLGDVPVIGALMRSSSWEKNETDLVIIITPHLVRPKGPENKLATPFDKALPGNDVDQFLLGKQEIPRGQPVPLTGHILDWKDEEPVKGGYKDVSQ